MLSKSQIKLVNSLKHKKFRQKHQLFIVEGVKVIKEILKSNLEVEALFATVDLFSFNSENFYLISETDLAKISALSTPQVALALVNIPNNNINVHQQNSLTVALDGVRDPGNLGTIIRLCDWFDVSTLICSPDTVDCYNPKVVQATMGSLVRVDVVYEDLNKVLTQTNLPIYGAFMNAEPIYSTHLERNGILVMGNEANGISAEIENLITHKISIPKFGSAEVESLNVATATSIMLSEFKRNQFTEK